MFIATTIDFGETCDSHTRLMGLYSTREKALEDVRADMNAVLHYLETNGAEAPKVDWEKHEIWKSEETVGSDGTVWDVLEADGTDII